MKTLRNILLFLFTFVLISCIKDDETETIETLKVYNYQMVSLDIGSSNFNEEEYTTELGGIQIHIAKGLDNKLHFIIPGELAPGTYDFQLNSIKAKYEVSKPSLDDSAENTILIFKNQLSNLSATLDNSEESIILQNNINAFNNSFNNFSNQEKNNIALFYKVNKNWFDYVILGDYSQSFNGRFFSNVNTNLIRSMVGVAIFTSGIVGVFYGTPELKVLGAVACAISWKNVTKFIKNIHDEGFVTLNLMMDGDTSEVDKSPMGLTFQNEVEKTLDFKTVDRKIIASDSVNATNKLFDFFKMYSTFNYWIDKANIIINYINTLPFVNFTLLTKFQLPATSPNTNNAMIQEIFNGISFGINNPNLTLQSTTFSNNQLKVKIKNNSDNQVSDYLRYSYSDGFSTFSGKFPITVSSSSNILEGIWNMDLVLGTGNCDETLLEDEMNIPPKFKFNDNGTLTFVTDPVDSDLNGSGFSNTYSFSNNELKIKCYYNDSYDNIKFDAILTYNQTTGKFQGTYTNTWTDGTICTNSLSIYK